VVLLRAPREGVKASNCHPRTWNCNAKNGSWRVQNASFSVPADPEAVKNLLDALQLVQSDAPIENATDLRQYGLEKNRRRAWTWMGKFSNLVSALLSIRAAFTHEAASASRLFRQF
jgi:hypothetical protein